MTDGDAQVLCSFCWRHMHAGQRLSQYVTTFSFCDQKTHCGSNSPMKCFPVYSFFCWLLVAFARTSGWSSHCADFQLQQMIRPVAIVSSIQNSMQQLWLYKVVWAGKKHQFYWNVMRRGTSHCKECRSVHCVPWLFSCPMFREQSPRSHGVVRALTSWS